MAKQKQEDILKLARQFFTQERVSLVRDIEGQIVSQHVPVPDTYEELETFVLHIISQASEKAEEVIEKRNRKDADRFGHAQAVRQAVLDMKLHTPKDKK